MGMSPAQTLQQNSGPTVKGSDRSQPVQSRAEKAAVEAISSPLFDGRSIQAAKKGLVNVTGGPSLGIREAMSATEVIQDEAGDDCEVIFGTVINEAMEGHLHVTIIATGLREPPETRRPVRVDVGETTALTATPVQATERWPGSPQAHVLE